MIDFTCTNCGVSLRSEDSAAGQGTVCPECGGGITVPKVDGPGTPDSTNWQPVAAQAATPVGNTAPGQYQAAYAKPMVKQCPKCVMWIDKAARICPYCQSKQPLPPWRIVFAVVGAVLFALILWASGAFHKGAGQDDRDNDKIGAQVRAEEFVKQRLVSPGSADFGGWSDFQHPDDCVTCLGGGRYRVTGWVDAQNKFGAKIRSTFTCIVKKQGDYWSCESLDIHER